MADENRIVLNRTIGAMLRRIKDRRPLMKEISQIMLKAVQQNFETEGKRIGGWPQLKPATLKDRKRKGYTSGMLIRRGNLFRSISARATNDEAVVGTNKIYARIQQEGGTINMASRSETFIRSRYVKGNKKGKFKKGKGKAGQGFTFKAHTIKIPARPFLKVNKEDVKEIQRAIKSYLINEK